MDRLGIALGIVEIVDGMLWLGSSLAYEQPWVQKLAQRREAQARQRTADGYKVDLYAPYLWFSRTRLRAAVFGMVLIAFGLWFLASAKG